MNFADLQAGWAEWLIDALVASGVHRAVVSPGSRSTPLVLAIARAEEQGRMTSTVVVDERSAGFFALGQIRATGEPSLLICTSGTAGAHYLPAVVESSQARLPLIVLTADRPFELRGRGASQTIDQAGMFGRFVRKSIEVGLADSDPRAVDGLLRTAWLAVHAATWPEPGPVHLNLGLRKPLEPAGERDAELEALHQRVADALSRGLPAEVRSTMHVDSAALDEAADRIRGPRRGVMLLGPTGLFEAPDAGAVNALARASGFPILAEATSQHRFGANRPQSACDVFEPLFGSDSFLSSHAPDLVVQVGEVPVGRALGAWLAASGVERILIAGQARSEAFNQAAQILVGDAGSTLDALADRLSDRLSDDGSIDGAWARSLVEAANTAGEIIDAFLADGPADGPADAMAQGMAVRLAVQAVPKGGLLMLGNSMPVRDVDLYCRSASRDIGVLSQRGAAGIDGLVSSAIGAATASRRPTVLLLGDVSFQHDIGGLALSRESTDAGVAVAVVVVENGGGRLFELLPVRDQSGLEAMFERFFLTPPVLDIEKAAQAFGVPSRRVTEQGALAESLAEAMAGAGVTVIEAVVDGPASVEAIRGITTSVDATLRAPSAVGRNEPEKAIK